MSLVIAVDVKNLSLFQGGIANWLSLLLPAWHAHRKADKFVLIGPSGPYVTTGKLAKVSHNVTQWPLWLPRPVRHPFYDNIIFPRAIRQLKPDLIFSPYHDVRMPRKIPSIITVHDICYIDAAESYPMRVRGYYLFMLRVNLERAVHVLTVSQASRQRIIECFGIPPDRISVVYNALETEEIPKRTNSDSWRRTFPQGTKLLLYPGGIEYRKNIARLMEALRILWGRGHKICLIVTGSLDPRWRHLFPETDKESDKVVFLGRLTQPELWQAYQNTDAVIYPTLCEGFGRVCLESMATGTPLACSDLPVLREVAGDYPFYFNPFVTEDIAKSILQAINASHCEPRTDLRFSAKAVQSSFCDQMDTIIWNVENKIST